MPLPNTIAWRVVQLVSILWCVMISIGVSITSYWLLFKQQSMFGLVRSLVKDEMKDNVSFVEVTRFGSYAMILVSIWMGILFSYVIAAEKRWLTIMFVVFNVIIFVCALTFGVMGILASTKLTTITKHVFIDGVNQYTRLEKGTPGNERWRFVVDRVQIEGKCCGNTTYEVYKGMFENVAVVGSGTNRTAKKKTACICRGVNMTNCRLQHLPLSCCRPVQVCQSDKTQADPFCATNVFATSSSKCESTSQNQVTNGPAYNMDPCDETKIKKMWHVQLVLNHGIFNMVLTFMFGALGALMILMAIKTSSQRNFVKQEVQKTFKVDSDTASILVRDANEPSISSGGDGSQSSQRDGPQRLSSQRLTARDVSIGRLPDSERGRSTRAPPSESSERGKLKMRRK